MKKIISIPVYLGLASFGLAQNLLEVDYKNVSVSKIKDTISRNLTEASDSEKETISQQVLLSNRVDLTLLLFSQDIIQSILAKQIRELPEDEFKGKVIVEALKSKNLWLEKQKVNKGEQIRMMVSVCDGTLHHHFPNDPVSWLEYSDANSRIRLADDLAKSLRGEKVVKRNKDLNLSLPSHQPSTESDLNFEKGWKEIE